MWCCYSDFTSLKCTKQSLILSIMLHAAWFKCTQEILWSVKYSSFQSVILAYVIFISTACHIHGFFPKIAIETDCCLLGREKEILGDKEKFDTRLVLVTKICISIWKKLWLFRVVKNNSSEVWWCHFALLKCTKQNWTITPCN